MALLETASTALPILVLIVLGAVLRSAGVVTSAGIDQVKLLIVRVALPAVLFSSFLSIEISVAYLGLFVLVPAICFLLLGLGYLFRRTPLGRRYAPYLMTGFEFGMLGITLFGTAFGMERVGVIGVIGVAHELFIWFFYVTLMDAERGASHGLAATARSFVRSPVIVAIVVGIALNLLGVGPWFQSALVPRSFLRAMELLGGIIIPLILIVVGFGLRIDRTALRAALPTVAVRAALIGVLAALVAPWIVRVLSLAPIFEYALVTFLVLPPPFIVPLYMATDDATEVAYVNTVLSLYTVVSVAAFLLYLALASPVG